MSSADRGTRRLRLSVLLPVVVEVVARDAGDGSATIMRVASVTNAGIPSVTTLLDALGAWATREAQSKARGPYR